MKFCEVYTDPGYIESDGQHSIVQANDKGSPCKWNGVNSKKKRVIKYRVDGGIITLVKKLKKVNGTLDSKTRIFEEEI